MVAGLSRTRRGEKSEPYVSGSYFRRPAILCEWVDSWINCHGVWSGLTVAGGL